MKRNQVTEEPPNPEAPAEQGQSQFPPQVEESAEMLKQQLEELNKKYITAMAKEEEEEAAEKVKMPIADIMLKYGHGNMIPKQGVTPAEVAILCALHHKNVGGTPVTDIKITGEIEVDPIDLKRVLISRYSDAKVVTLFPGPIPSFPTRFIRAVKMGIMTSIQPERLMDYHVKPSMSGEE